MSYTPNVPAHIAALKAYVPGLPIEDLARRLDMPPARIAKLASNENPLGPSPRAIRALAESAIDVSLRSEEHTSELQSLMRISYAVFCLKNKKKTNHKTT